MKKNIKHQIKELEKEFKTAPVPNLDLSNKPHLQKIRQFVNDFTGSNPTPKELQKSPTQNQSLLDPYLTYQTNSTKQVPYCEVNYDLFELITFINKLDLSNKPHLQKIRQFVNDFTGKSNKSNTPPTLIQNNDFM
ncbi:hypothetical protein [Candidatus Phytoplasma solani]|uniref:hypothetical protein n=1 Tax=Candidatus Phytoplasma solani TaxID=69896 RepID=UPI00358F613B